MEFDTISFTSFVFVLHTELPSETSIPLIVISTLFPFTLTYLFTTSTVTSHSFSLFLFLLLLLFLRFQKLLPFTLMAEEDSSPGSPHSLKYKLKSSLCFSCCFPHNRVKPRITRSSSLHNNSRSTDLPYIKEKCSKFINKIGRRHRRHSADFHYDALNYALNFEDDAADEGSVNDLKSFSARLPASPPSSVSTNFTTTAAVAVEIAARS